MLKISDQSEQLSVLIVDGLSGVLALIMDLPKKQNHFYNRSDNLFTQFVLYFRDFLERQQVAFPPALFKIL
jgi:hypothetical protein